jgi:uncharacterized membrane protein
MGSGMQKATALVLVGALVLGAAVVAISSGQSVVALMIFAVGGGLIGWAMLRDDKTDDRR